MVNATIKPAPYRENQCNAILQYLIRLFGDIDLSLYLCTQSIKSSTRQGDSPTGFLENHGGQGTMWKKHL